MQAYSKFIDEILMVCMTLKTRGIVCKVCHDLKMTSALFPRKGKAKSSDFIFPVVSFIIDSINYYEQTIKSKLFSQKIIISFELGWLPIKTTFDIFLIIHCQALWRVKSQSTYEHNILCATQLNYLDSRAHILQFSITCKWNCVRQNRAHRVTLLTIMYCVNDVVAMKHIRLCEN